MRSSLLLMLSCGQFWSFFMFTLDSHSHSIEKIFFTRDESLFCSIKERR
jgi:hypothetical protein